MCSSDEGDVKRPLVASCSVQVREFETLTQTNLKKQSERLQCQKTAETRGPATTLQVIFSSWGKLWQKIDSYRLLEGPTASTGLWRRVCGGGGGVDAEMLQIWTVMDSVWLAAPVQCNKKCAVLAGGWAAAECVCCFLCPLLVFCLLPLRTLVYCRFQLYNCFDFLSAAAETKAFHSHLYSTLFIYLFSFDF